MAPRFQHCDWFNSILSAASQDFIPWNKQWSDGSHKNRHERAEITGLSFTQLRLYCSKKKGRTFHVTTADNITGEAVVQYFSGQTDVQPASCGSYVRMENDNSKLARVCKIWGRNGKWRSGESQERLYKSLAFSLGCFWNTKPPYFLCDDVNSSPTSSGDFWKVNFR